MCSFYQTWHFPIGVEELINNKNKHNFLTFPDILTVEPLMADGMGWEQSHKFTNDLYFAMTDVHVESAHPTHSDPNNQAMFTRFNCVNCLLSGTKLEIVAIKSS